MEKPQILITFPKITNTWNFTRPTREISYTPILTDYTLIEQDAEGKWFEPDPFKTGCKVSWHSFGANHSITLGAGRSWKQAAGIAKRYFENNILEYEAVEIIWQDDNQGG